MPKPDATKGYLGRESQAVEYEGDERELNPEGNQRIEATATATGKVAWDDGPEQSNRVSWVVAGHVGQLAT